MGTTTTWVGTAQGNTNREATVPAAPLLFSPANIRECAPSMWQSLCWWQEHWGFLNFSFYFLKLSCVKSTLKFLIFFRSDTVIPSSSHSSRHRHQSCKRNLSLQLQQALLANAAEVLLYSSVPFKYITINNSIFSHGKIKPLKQSRNQDTCCYWNIRKCV